MIILSKAKELYKEWLSKYKDNITHMDWKEYYYYNLSVERIREEIELPQSRLDTLEYYNDTGDILEYMQRLYHWSRKKIL